MIASAMLAAPAFAATQTGLTLEQAVATALEKNPAHKVAVFEQRAAAADVKQARSTLLPQVRFGEDYQRQ
ncbi:MAG TPA: TolC family protein [Terriglobales bacterium]|nr:TolC family protein [Terriglobales bacterium]